MNKSFGTRTTDQAITRSEICPRENNCTHPRRDQKI